MLHEVRRKVRLVHGADLCSEGVIYPIGQLCDRFGVGRNLHIEGKGTTMTKIRFKGCQAVSIVKQDGGKRVQDSSPPPRTL